MTDIVERLREEVENWLNLEGPYSVDLCKEAADEIERLRAALKDIQREAMTLKPPRPSWYYDRAQNALTNSDEPLVRDGLAPPPSRT